MAVVLLYICIHVCDTHVHVLIDYYCSDGLVCWYCDVLLVVVTGTCLSCSAFSSACFSMSEKFFVNFCAPNPALVYNVQYDIISNNH